jgi:hypothetical protein
MVASSWTCHVSKRRCLMLPIPSWLPLKFPRLAALGLCFALPVAQRAGAQSASKPAELTPAEVTAPAVDPAKLAQWVHELDSDRFAIREAAQVHLLATGVGALDAVGDAASTGSLESSTRAVGILLTWARSTDSDLSLGALERLAKLTNRPSESAMATERLASVRERAAMDGDAGHHAAASDHHRPELEGWQRRPFANYSGASCDDDQLLFGADQRRSGRRRAFHLRTDAVLRVLWNVDFR